MSAMTQEIEAMFYSQMLNVPRKENTCAKCEKTFSKWSQYHEHVTTVNCSVPRELPPVSSRRNLVGVKSPLSDEQRAEVIKRWESKQKKGAII